jgi:hypothetical protein
MLAFFFDVFVGELFSVFLDLFFCSDLSSPNAASRNPSERLAVELSAYQVPGTKQNSARSRLVHNKHLEVEYVPRLESQQVDNSTRFDIWFTPTTPTRIFTGNR